MSKASVLGNFDFYKVQRVMEMLDWKWAAAENGVPSVGELVDEAIRLLDSAKEHPNIRISSGGLRARYIPEDADGGEFWSLEFVLEEVEVW